MYNLKWFAALLVVLIAAELRSQSWVLYSTPDWKVSEKHQMGTVGFQFQPRNSNVFLDFYSQYSSETGVPVFDLTRHSSGLALGFQLQFFPWAPQKLITAKRRCFRPLFNNGQGCYGKRKRRSGFDPMAGIWIGPGYEYRNAHLYYAYSPDSPNSQSEYRYRITSHGASLRAGYQIQVWRFMLGISNGVTISKPNWEGNGPNIFSVNESGAGLQLHTNTRITIGLFFNNEN